VLFKQQNKRKAPNAVSIWGGEATKKGKDLRQKDKKNIFEEVRS